MEGPRGLGRALQAVSHSVPQCPTVSLALSPSEIRALIVALFRRKSRKGRGSPTKQELPHPTSRGPGLPRGDGNKLCRQCRPYLGAAGARPGPGVPAGSDRARDGRSGHCSVLRPLLLARDPHGENRRKSEQILPDLQLQHSPGPCFSPHCPWWLFWTQFSPKIAVNATTAGPFMVSVATSSPCRG